MARPASPGAGGSRDEAPRRAYRSPLRDAQVQATRRAVVAAAHDLFVEVGYAAATVEAIAERAGVSRKTVFTAVGGKAVLLDRALDFTGRTAAAAMIRSLTALFLHEGSKVERACVVSDLRAGEYFEELAAVIDELEADGVANRVLFLEAEEQELLTRYRETRRRHPLARDGNVADGVRREQGMLTPIRDRADTIIDTTGLSTAALRRKVASEMLAPAEQVLLRRLAAFAGGWTLEAVAAVCADDHLASHSRAGTSFGSQAPAEREYPSMPRDLCRHQGRLHELATHHCHPDRSELASEVEDLKLWCMVA